MAGPAQGLGEEVQPGPFQAACEGGGRPVAGHPRGGVLWAAGGQWRRQDHNLQHAHRQAALFSALWAWTTCRALLCWMGSQASSTVVCALGLDDVLQAPLLDGPPGKQHCVPGQRLATCFLSVGSQVALRTMCLSNVLQAALLHGPNSSPACCFLGGCCESCFVEGAQRLACCRQP